MTTQGVTFVSLVINHLFMVDLVVTHAGEGQDGEEATDSGHGNRNGKGKEEGTD